MCAENSDAHRGATDDYLHDGDVPLTARRADDQVDMTPMVDVTFLLLIFFMITAAFALQKSIEVPAASEGASQKQTVEDLEQDSLVIRVDGDNVYWVGAPQWSAERRAASVPEMMAQLRAARADENGTFVLNRLLVEANGDATHDRVVAALDAGVGAGMEEIRLLSYEEGEL